MPELPDLEGYRRYFNRFARGRRVERVEVLDRTMLRNSSPQALGRALAGRSFQGASRRGKWLLAPAGGPMVVMHFGMTGRLQWSAHRSGPSARGSAPHRHDRLVLHLQGGELAYRNMRKLGGVWLARDEEEAEGLLGSLGPDATRIGRDELAEIVARRRGGIKALLMDQEAIAGVGNLLSDEILWRARLHPRRSTATLSPEELDALHAALQGTVRDASPRGRIPPDPGWLTGARDAGGPCPRCGRGLERATVAGRTACWCPRCQRR